MSELTEPVKALLDETKNWTVRGRILIPVLRFAIDSKKPTAICKSKELAREFIHRANRFLYHALRATTDWPELSDAAIELQTLIDDARELI